SMRESSIRLFVIWPTIEFTGLQQRMLLLVTQAAAIFFRSTLVRFTVKTTFDSAVVLHLATTTSQINMGQYVE
ncbi:hypothetical protein AAF712_016919, partial [Marasmius tenuissimus]